MRYVNDFGVIYRVSERNYLTMLRRLAKGEPARLSQLGFEVATLDLNITDMGAEEAQMNLDWLKSSEKED